MPAENTLDSQYRPQDISKHFDEFGMKEWERLTSTPVDEISLHIHKHYLEKYVQAGWRVLEVGSGAGRFTQLLAGIGARISVADISPEQLRLNQHMATQFDFAQAVESWQQVDICDLRPYADTSFDCVVVYGGPFSYVLDQREAALQECLRVLKPGGPLLLSVMSLWGSVRRFLTGVLDVPAEYNQRIISQGDITSATLPGRDSNWMHLFRAGELRAWLEEAGLQIIDMSASGCLAVGRDAALVEIRNDPAKWQELLRMELEATASPGALDAGTHIIAIARSRLGQ
jgi:SAM-dependent methyltransferase